MQGTNKSSEILRLGAESALPLLLDSCANHVVKLSASELLTE